MLPHLAAIFPTLLLLYWSLTTFAATLACIPIPGTQNFRYASLQPPPASSPSHPLPNANRNAVLLSACRGKLMDIKPQAALGFLSNWTVPQRWFAHFYFIGAIWNAWLAFLFIASQTQAQAPAVDGTFYFLAAFALEFHLLRRLAETVAVLHYPDGARMHGIAYLFGVSYYIVVPLSIIPYASNALYASILTRTWTSPATATMSRFSFDFNLLFSPSSLAPIHWIGIAIFACGNALQFHSHLKLSQLSSTSKWKKTNAPPKYKIPRGGAFEYVSCPHYLAEIVIYIGLACIAGDPADNLLPYLMVLWVVRFACCSYLHTHTRTLPYMYNCMQVANLVLAASLTHEWYHSRFKTYPRHRKALIPYIY